jgi:hypothetical protein
MAEPQGPRIGFRGTFLARGFAPLFICFFLGDSCRVNTMVLKKILLWGSGVLPAAADCVREKFGLLPAFAPVHASGFIGQVLATLPPAPIVWLAACFCDWMRASLCRQHSCARALLDSPARTLIGIPNSLCCTTFCESVRLLVDSPNRDIRINAISLGVCVSLG